MTTKTLGISGGIAAAIAALALLLHSQPKWVTHQAPGAVGRIGPLCLRGFLAQEARSSAKGDTTYYLPLKGSSQRLALDSSARFVVGDTMQVYQYCDAGSAKLVPSLK